MSEHDDTQLEDFMEGKSSLNEAYRAGGQEEPRAELDARILAAASDAVKGDNDTASDQSTGLGKRPQWLVPLSVAATVMLGVNLAYNLKDFSSAPEFENNGSAVMSEAESVPAPTADLPGRNDTGGETLSDTSLSEPAKKTAAQWRYDEPEADDLEKIEDRFAGNAGGASDMAATAYPDQSFAKTVEPQASPKPADDSVLNEVVVTGARNDDLARREQRAKSLLEERQANIRSGNARQQSADISQYSIKEDSAPVVESEDLEQILGNSEDPDDGNGQIDSETAAISDADADSPAQELAAYALPAPPAAASAPAESVSTEPVAAKVEFWCQRVPDFDQQIDLFIANEASALVDRPSAWLAEIKALVDQSEMSLACVHLQALERIHGRSAIPAGFPLRLAP